jgi:hypothetical protein
MNVWPAGPFWALRPRFTARRLELACWLAGLALATALVVGTNSSEAGASPAGVAGILSSAATVSGLASREAGAGSNAIMLATDYQTRCIKRVIALTAIWRNLDVGKQIERQCLMRRLRTSVVARRTWTAMTCTPISVWRPPIASARPTGCPN